MPTLHSHTHCQVVQADTQAKTWQRVCLSPRSTEPTDKLTVEKETRCPNRILRPNQIFFYFCNVKQQTTVIFKPKAIWESVY